MKLISWNVNGLRACITKGFSLFFKSIDADIFCIQETKMQEEQAKEIEYEGYYKYMNSAEKKGYSGTAIFTKIMPINVSYGIGIEEHDKEGRVITLEFDKFFLVNCYTPNSKRELERLAYRKIWEDEFRNYLIKLDKVKPVILCGDLNVAHKEIDLKNPSNFTDTFRYLYPDKKDAYSWWSYMLKSRERNIGWRIDYFIVSNSIRDEIKDAIIHSEVLGSDHCPIELDIF